MDAVIMPPLAALEPGSGHAPLIRPDGDSPDPTVRVECSAPVP